MKIKVLALPFSMIIILLCVFAALLYALKQHDVSAPDRSVRLERQNPQGNPLIRASAAGQPKQVRCLLDESADVQTQSAVPNDPGGERQSSKRRNKQA